eukprot:sb/3465912/
MVSPLSGSLLSRIPSNMTFDFGAPTHYNTILNYMFGVFMVGCFLISTILNPLIYYSYTYKNKTIQNFLFKVIAVTDFMTNLVPTIFMAYVFLSRVQFKYTFVNQLPEFFSCTFGCISQVTTTMLAVTRMISIIRPFLRVRFKLVLAYLIFYAIYMSFGNAGSLIITGIKDHQRITDGMDNGRSVRHANETHNEVHGNYSNHHNNHLDLSVLTLETLNKFVCFVMNVLHCFIGIVCSFATVLYLRCIMVGNTEGARKLKSCTTILIMNVPYVTSIISNFVAFYQLVNIDFKLVNHYMLPILTSAFNPCVIVARTNALRLALHPELRRASYTRSTMATSMNPLTRGMSMHVIFENPTSAAGPAPDLN